MVKEPESMDELVYHTLRVLDNGGNVRLWAKRQKCPQCGKALMGKPKDQKTGKAKIRAKEYECPSCHYIIEKQAYEDGLIAEAKYTCQKCKKLGDWSGSFKRKKIDGVPTIRVICQHCGNFIDVTQKFKEKKGKGEVAEDV